MKERPVDLERAVVAYHQAPIIPQPADGALDDRRRYRRKARPSCVAGRTRFFLCGQINAIPRCRNRFRSASLS